MTNRYSLPRKQDVIDLREQFNPLTDGMLRAFLHSITPANRSAAKFAVRYFPRNKGHAAAAAFIDDILRNGSFTDTDVNAVWALMENLFVTIRLVSPGDVIEQVEMFA